MVRKNVAAARRQQIRNDAIMMSCSVAGIPDRGSGDKSASTNWQFHRRGAYKYRLDGCLEIRLQPSESIAQTWRRYFTSGQPPSFIGLKA